MNELIINSYLNELIINSYLYRAFSVDRSYFSATGISKYKCYGQWKVSFALLTCLYNILLHHSNIVDFDTLKVNSNFVIDKIIIHVFLCHICKKCPRHKSMTHFEIIHICICIEFNILSIHWEYLSCPLTRAIVFGNVHPSLIFNFSLLGTVNSLIITVNPPIML